MLKCVSTPGRLLCPANRAETHFNAARCREDCYFLRTVQKCVSTQHGAGKTVISCEPCRSACQRSTVPGGLLSAFSSAGVPPYTQLLFMNEYTLINFHYNLNPSLHTVPNASCRAFVPYCCQPDHCGVVTSLKNVLLILRLVRY